MDLEAARKALSKRNTFYSKRVVFFGVVGLCLFAGVLLRLGFVLQSEVEQNAPVTDAASPPPTATPAVEATKSVSQPVVEQNAPGAAVAPPLATATTAVENGVTASTEQVEASGNTVGELKPAGEADEHAEAELPGSGTILVARRPVEVLASPSSSAPALYGFPAGRPFRVIGRQGGFAHIQDLRSSASGWIDEAALAEPPPAPAASAPVQSKTFSTSGKPMREDSTVTANPGITNHGLFDRGGLFGGIFGNGN
jgi:hypothetical protein